MLKDFGWQIHTISVNLFDQIKDYPTFLQLELIKILLFNFTAYQSVGFLSSQSMVTTNIDHLFECGQNALCGTPNDEHHQIYHQNQRHFKKLLGSNNEEYILYDQSGRMIKNNNLQQTVFDDNIFVISPETEMYQDMFTFMTSPSNDHTSSSYLSEYFYHYCKGNGYPIQRQKGEYDPPKVSFECEENGNECKMKLEISKSPCYILSDEGYNFHPSHSDHISASWHWKQSIKHLFIKNIQYTSHHNGNDYKPWKWRYALFSAWMQEWNKYAVIEPNLYFDFLLNTQSNEELIYSLWQIPFLYFLFVTVGLSTFTALSTPCFNLCHFGILFVSKSYPLFIYVLLHTFKWTIFPILLLWNVQIILLPIKQIFFDQGIIPSDYPYAQGWILGLQYIYFVTCLKFVIICFVNYWLGCLYHPVSFKIKWFNTLQLKWFAFNNKRPQFHYNDIESGGGKRQRMSRHLLRRSNDFVDESAEDAMWFEQMYNFINWKLHNHLLKYFNVLVIIVIKWCLWYLFCILCSLWTIWILRFNDWYELKIIVGSQMIISLIWMCYCSICANCHFFIYPQLQKYGELYYDSHAFEKGN